jgi:nitroimidazol reductase NimA-like FMN-containing flavoprotein (pyridoxamine 5'-phosphate oxidase superfamily)
LPDRACYDRATIHRLLDEGLVAHVGVTLDGQPFVIPMNYARDRERLLLHGARSSRLMTALLAGSHVCLTVTHVDGLVVGRSATRHTMNYRSVMVFGQAREIADPPAKLAAVKAFVEHFLPGGWELARPPTPAEMAAVVMVEIPLDEASAKIRTGPPRLTPTDRETDHWSGELPLRLAMLPPVPHPADSTAPLPPAIADYQRSGMIRIPPGQSDV